MRLPHRNRRLHWHYSHYYDRTTRDIVAAYYKRDIEQFGYEFDHAFLRLAFNWPGARRAAQPAPERSQDLVGVAATNGQAPTVPSATDRPPVRRRIWQRRPRLMAAASFALALGIFGVSSVATPLAVGDNAMPEPVRQFIEESAAPVPSNAGNGFFARAHRFRRTMSDLNLSIQIVPAAGSGAILTLAADPMEGSRDYVPASAPVVSRSSNGPVPRWWLRHNRHNWDN